MMFRFMRPITLNAFGSLNSTRKGGVTLLPAIFTLGDSRIHVRSSDCSNVVAHVEAPINKKFSVLPTLHIPNIYPNDGHVRFWWDFDNPWFGCKGNVVENMVLFENTFDFRREKPFLRVCMWIKWYSGDFKVWFRLRESGIFDLKSVNITRVLDISVYDSKIQLLGDLVGNYNDFCIVRTNIVD